MSDAEEGNATSELAPINGGEDSSSSVLDDTFTPGVLVRLQYSSYLFLAFVMSMLFKGGLGHVFSAKVVTEACAGDFAKHMGGHVLEEACQGNMLVYRTSFALTLFFFFMFLTVSDLTCCVDGKSRAEFQQKFFCWKSLALTIMFIAVYWIPSSFFTHYAWICMFASAIFLVLQIILIVDFSYQWSEEWGSRAEDNSKWNCYLLSIAVLSYIGGVVLIILSYVYFVPHQDCNANAFIITSIAFMAVVYTLVAVWVPHGSIVPSGIVFAYTAFTCFTALRLSPDQTCNKLYSAPGDESMKMTVLSAIFSAGALAYSVVSTGGSRNSVSLATEEELAAEDPDQTGHLANYCYFHLIMMMGSMYLAMIVSNWTISGGTTSFDTTSSVAYWVKTSSCWLTIFVYMWSLLAPYFCCKDRDFGVPEWN